MDPVTIVLIALIAGLIIMVGVLLWQRRGNAAGGLTREDLEFLKRDVEAVIKEGRGDVEAKLKDINENVYRGLKDSSQTMQQQFKQSSDIIRNVTERLSKLDETNKQVLGFSEQIKNLQDILKNPKQRGILGEYYLETLLKNMFPPAAYVMQYKFSDGEIVDAVIKVKDKLISVDSKFSLENYNKLAAATSDSERKQYELQFKQDLKNRIDETSKYVRPHEHTYDFAFMFIPAEAIYYDLLVNRVGSVKSNAMDLIEYAFKEKKVIIVSPTSFFAYLQMVLQGLKALQIEESAKEIKINVERLGKHLRAYDEYMIKMGGHLGNTVGSFNSAHKEFGKIDKDVARITEGKSTASPMQLDRPDDID